VLNVNIGVFSSFSQVASVCCLAGFIMMFDAFDDDLINKASEEKKMSTYIVFTFAFAILSAWISAIACEQGMISPNEQMKH
jgi:hypothetical protein